MSAPTFNRNLRRSPHPAVAEQGGHEEGEAGAHRQTDEFEEDFWPSRLQVHKLGPLSTPTTNGELTD